MEVAVIVLGILVGVLVALLLIQRRRPDVDAKAFQGLIGELESKITESAFGVREKFAEGIMGLEKEVATLRTGFEEQKDLQKWLRDSTSRIEGVLTGTKKGATGENILGNMLHQLPLSMVECNLSIGGKPVEYAFVLPNKKKLPLDCKFPASELLERIASQPDGVGSNELHKELESRVMSQVENVRKYIDPPQTMDFALMAVPDSAFGILSIQRLYEAYKRSVLILSYSMTVPYLLSMYQLLLQYGSQIEIGSLHSALEAIVKHCGDIRQELEHKVNRGNAMIGNAYNQIGGLIGRIEGDVQRLRVFSEDQNQADR